jgi:hypothetical protein
MVCQRATNLLEILTLTDRTRSMLRRLNYAVLLASRLEGSRKLINQWSANCEQKCC